MVERGKEDEISNGANVQVADGRLGITWTVAYYAILVAGAVGFWKGFWLLTSSSRSLANLTSVGKS